MRTFSVSKLKSYNLSELRTLGREIGVKAPTTKRKDELINAIINILDGVTPPHNTTRGRPELNRGIMTNEVINNIKEQIEKPDNNHNKNPKLTRSELILKVERITNELKELFLELI